MSKKLKSKAKHILEDLDVFEVSLVSRPAIGRTYLLTKSADSGLHSYVSEHNLETETTEVGNTPTNTGANTMNEQLVELLKNSELELAEDLSSALDIILTNKEAVPENFMQDYYKLAGYEVPKEEVKVEVEVERIVEVEKTETPNDKEEILKGLDEPARALFKELEAKEAAAQKAANVAKEVAEAERQDRILKEFVNKAATNFGALPKTADELGVVLKAIKDKLEDSEAKVVMDIFEIAKEALASTEQFEEVQKATSTNTIDEPAYIVKAKALVEKGDYPSIAQAVDDLLRKEPKLFEED